MSEKISLLYILERDKGLFVELDIQVMSLKKQLEQPPFDCLKRMMPATLSATCASQCHLSNFEYRTGNG